MQTTDKAAIRRAKRRDRIARWIITLGGVTIIASVVAILAVIVGVTIPLLRPARSSLVARTRLPESVASENVLSLGVDMGLDGRALTAHLLTSDGTFTIEDLHGEKVLGRQQVRGPADGRATIVSVEHYAGSLYSLLWSDGSASLVEVTVTAEFDERGNRTNKYAVRTLATVPSEETPAQSVHTPVHAMVRRSEEGAITCVRQFPDNRLSVVRQVTVEDLLGGDLMGNGETKTYRVVLSDDIPGPIGAMTMNREGSSLFVGTKNGLLISWHFDDEGRIARREIIPAFRDKRAVTSLAMVLGDVTLAVGDATGRMTTWFEVRTESTRKLRQSHELGRRNAPVKMILASCRNKTLMSLDADGTARLDYPTSERHLLTLEADAPLRMIGFSPRGDAAIGLDDQDNLVAWRIDNPHPEISWGTLFGKVWYEDYDKPEYAWQTTGGEEFEPKFSLIPLLHGTLKGTLYAMFFAVPLALFGAVYTSHFTTPGLKRTIKPVVEIMAAIPSVVVGFLIALWLAPIIQHWMPAVFASLATIPLAFVTFMVFWQVTRKYDWAKRVERGYEFLMLIPVVAVGVGLALWLATPLESLLFDGNFGLWLFETLQMRYDQRNCIIIAFGLGFAVIPIIFSISEDSLSNVPHSLAAASLAMGASRWQTVWRVVLPSASPGIFAAVMIGFGRAVGETMIVLMATGNTPILDWSPFNGMRTLSANIAVEIPEAPVDGTLYRVLFLCAVVLFLLTFMLNTVAELVRHHLRKQYGRF
jgi:phosphate transport system permease protein